VERCPLRFSPPGENHLPRLTPREDVRRNRQVPLRLSPGKRPLRFSPPGENHLPRLTPGEDAGEPQQKSPQLGGALLVDVWFGLRVGGHDRQFALHASVEVTLNGTDDLIGSHGRGDERERPRFTRQDFLFPVDEIG